MSIVLPVHGASPVFTRCLEAVQRLDPQPAELLVVVDGGDRRLAAMAAAAGAHVVVQLPQAGPAVARNTGAVRASGDVVLFLDSDVVVPTDLVARVATIFCNQPDVAAVIGSYDDRPPAANLTSRYKNLLQHYVHQHARAEGTTFWGACGAIRRDVFLRLGGFDEDYVAPSIEDIELGYRLRSAGDRIRMVKDLQVTHLKRWSVRSLLKTDVLHRALPWSALILRTKRLDNDLNIDWWERVKAALVSLAALALVAAFWWPRTILLVAGALLAMFALDARFLAFLRGRGGAGLSLWGAGWHTLYHLYSAIGFAAAAIRHLMFGAQPVWHPWPGSPRRWPARLRADLDETTPDATDAVLSPKGAGTHERVIVAAGPSTTTIAIAPGESEPATERHRVAFATRKVAPQQLLTRSRRIRRWVPIALLLVVGALLVPNYRNTVQVDGLAYVRIAQYYSDGDFAHAINGFWGPLYSWLLAPLLRIGIEPLLATKLLQLGIGAATLVALRRLCVACGIPPATADGMTLVAVPLVLYLVFQPVSADLLVALFLLLFCGDFVPTDQRPDRARAIRAGIWAGLAFLTKAYALPAVVLTILAVCARDWLRARRSAGDGTASRGRFPRGDAVIMLATMGIVAAPWVATMTIHFGEFTVSQSATYNVEVLAPGSAGQPMTAGLVEPPHREALFAWEDPSTMPLDTDGWGASLASVRRVVDNVAGNLRDAVRLVAANYVAVTAFAAVGAVTLVRRSPRTRRATPWSRLIPLVAIYVAGYLLTVVEPEYLWFAVLAIVPLAAVAVDLPILRPTLAYDDPDRSTWRLAGFVVLAALVAGQAALSLPWRTDSESVADIAARLEKASAGDALVRARVASANNWEESSVLCFHLKCTYLGETAVRSPGDSLPTDDVAAGLAERADYYFVWREAPYSTRVPPSGALGPLVAEVEGVAVYSTKRASQ
ncbi:MAG: glycosyltransferase [Acidimicrobiia bacterium]